MRFPLFNSGYAVGLLAVLAVGCSSKNPDTPTPTPDASQPQGTLLTTLPADVAVKWAAMSLRVTAKTLSNTPTYASREFGYLGLGMYESTVYGIPKHQSLAGQLTDLKALPKPESGKVYDWSLSLNACESSLLKNLYSHAPANQLAAVDSLETVTQEQLAKSVAADVVTRSVAYGKAIATALFEWSKTDGGYEGYKNPFPTDYRLPTAEGIWVAPTDGQVAIARALHPRWGSNRTFVPATAAMPTPKPIPFSRDPLSDYFKMYKAVYDKNKQLTQADKEAAIWWSDDPSQTFSPPGHSYYLATLAVKTTGANLAQAVETYARAGMAVADAFICCFKTKYTYVNERPSSFIRSNIEMYWSPFWPEPPFPGFSSGHSTQGAATATVLTDLYGANVHFTDDAHVGRPRDTFRNVDFKARSFNSFWEAAEESGMSRILGGIHTQQDNDTGLSEGKKIGTSINSLVWKK